MTNDLLLNPYTATDFSRESCITLSTVHRAKGNEAAVVFVVGIDALYKDRNKRAARNKIFTAFTRAKGWLRVSGMAEKAKYFFHEIDKALENYPNLIFTQPDLKEVNTLQRDLTDKSKKLKEIKEEMREKLKLIGLSEDEIIEQIEDMLKKV
jgi:superfamily I DNA and RNA helicase